MLMVVSIDGGTVNNEQYYSKKLMMFGNIW